MSSRLQVIHTRTRLKDPHDSLSDSVLPMKSDVRDFPLQQDHKPTCEEKKEKIS